MALWWQDFQNLENLYFHWCHDHTLPDSHQWWQVLHERGVAGVNTSKEGGAGFTKEGELSILKKGNSGEWDTLLSCHVMMSMTICRWKWSNWQWWLSQLLVFLCSSSKLKRSQTAAASRDNQVWAPLIASRTTIFALVLWYTLVWALWSWWWEFEIF